MARQITPPTKRDFLFTSYIPLPGFPVACKINNVSLLSELLFDKTILAFGKYDLVFCLQKESIPDPKYDTTVVTRTFCEPIELAGPQAAVREAIEVQAFFSLPLHVRFRVGKPQKLNFWDFLKNQIMSKTWVEAQVEGQIAADIAAARESSDPELAIEESLPQTRAGRTAEQDDMAIRQNEAAIALETLAELVQKIISQHQGERAAIDLEALAEQVQEIISQRQEAKVAIDPEALAEKVQAIISQRQEETAAKDKAARREIDGPERSSTPMPDAILPDRGEPEALNMAKVTETVLNILHAREAARARQEQYVQYAPAIGRPAQSNASRPEGTRYPQAPGRAPASGWGAAGYPPVPVPMSLGQIPSRPGLEVNIHNPPPKPPGAGG